MIERPKRPATRPVVAELGRPETPAETAERKAASRRRHREHQTFSNLAAAIVVCLGVVLVMVLVVPRPELPPRPEIDVAAGAEQAAVALGAAIAVPKLPAGWSANAAEVRRTPGGVDFWYVGYVTPAGQFLSTTQAVQADPTWLASEVDQKPESGERTEGAITWTRYGDGVDASFVFERGAVTTVVDGTADESETTELLTALGSALAAAGST